MAEERVYATRQERSRRTLDRILAATERLLQEHDFDVITMQQVATEAECAVGTLYGRVRNKKALLGCLFDRYMAIADESARRLTGDSALADATLTERVERVVATTVHEYAAHRGVVRTLARDLFFQETEDRTEFRRNATASFRRVARFLAAAPDDIAHTDREEACLFALASMTAMAQNRIVFGTRSGIRTSWSRSSLRRHLEHAMLSYLTSPPREA